MRIAFYAPLKPPDHPVPSGDRLLARLFQEALRRGGHDVALASRLRTYEGRGDALRQARLAATGARIAERLVRRWQRAPAHAPQAWFTYHLYHKAPDPLGPVVSRALAIPYVVAEASHARKQAHGPWRSGYAAAEAALHAADAVVCVNPHDVPGIDALCLPRAERLVLPPFIDVAAFVAAGETPAARAAALALAPPLPGPRLITVAMMRPGDKLASYDALAHALFRLAGHPWHLVVVGDGSARAEVESLFAGLQPRVRFVGTQPPDVVAALLATADLFVWPAVAEVLGLAMLEAHACGVPVVAGRRPGSEAIVDDGHTGRLVHAGDVDRFAAAVVALLDDPGQRRRLGQQAAARARTGHDVGSAARALDALLRRLGASP